ncbi:hypothetical protein KOAAANKH_02574 [Brevundimonas sp. NIBR10]|uniref:Nin-like protein n=1 Tax=Brevundimonas sp. NIBR10 TaxID=3015997 RepID=UPI0022F17660|nr:Nin-like protein [Brevundimonas sp. NIBR10]WGM47692.1 hypothetical protein KOAAANKH_02574 [Brevundimonas sp. NIBR10]
MSDPFIIDGPCLWSFSGGRTSAYMLWRALQSYGGKLPNSHVVVFCNTGKEREETLVFVNECATRWGVEVRWLEFRTGGKYVEVSFETASRNGEPFDALIAWKQAIPNSFMRFCTEQLKVLTVRRFLTETLGWSHCNNPVGLRADEGKRVARQRARPDALWTVHAPLYDAGVTVDDVMEFWSEQDFDLGLQPWEGNCDKCFLKGEAILTRLEYDRPGSSQWWADKENNSKGYRFRKGRRSYAEIMEYVRQSPLLVKPPVPDDEYDVECGLTCGAA